MRIDPATLVSITEPRERAATPAGRPQGSPASVVSLGEAASAAGTSSADPAVTARIARIRDELATGSYVVDLDKLSEAILDDDLERTPS
jgi:anti-sigma28 factor (negative regulator of flagellin synthesis)